MSASIAEHSSWAHGDAPKDGQLYVAIGRVVGSDEWGGRSAPFLSQVRWHCDAGFGFWVDECGMAISSDIEARVYIDHWCALPCDTDRGVEVCA